MEQNESKEARQSTMSERGVKMLTPEWNPLWKIEIIEICGIVYLGTDPISDLYLPHICTRSLSLSFSLLALYRFLFITITNVFTGESVRIHLVCVHRVWIKYESNKEPDREYNERVSVMLQPCNMHIAQWIHHHQPNASDVFMGE